MKRYIFMALSAAALSFASCSENTLDEINKNNGDPAPDAVPAYLQLSDAIMCTGFQTVSGDYAFYLSSLNEQTIGVGNNQLRKAELRQKSEWMASTTFNNNWNSTYGNLMNIREMIRKVETEIPGNVGHFDVLGMAQTLEAMNFGILTDLHGDIPYSEALQGQNNMQPKIDSQKDIYTGILATLDKAIANLDKAKAANTGNQDLLFSGNIKKWKGLAYALKARYTLHKSAVEENVWAEVEKYVNQAIELGFDGAQITIFNLDDIINPWDAYLDSRGYTASSTTVANLMTDKDPRYHDYVYSYWDEDEDENLVFIEGEAYNPGDAVVSGIESWYLSYPKWYDIYADTYYEPIHLFSKAELYFILAEAQLRQGKDANEAFQTATTAGIMEMLKMTNEEINGEQQAEVTAYVESLGEADLQKVFEQKYLAQVYDENIETYNDLRRCKAMGEEYIKLTNPNNNISGVNLYPELLPYGNDGVLGNPNIKAAYGNGEYVYSKKTWVNGGK